MEHDDYYYEMMKVEGDSPATCAVYDQTPGSEQKKICIVVRPTYTVAKVISDITTQYRYETFDLLLQPIEAGDNLIYLNDCKSVLIYDVPGFQPFVKNTLILLPSGKWDGNIMRRYDVQMPLSNNNNNICSNNNNNNNNSSAINSTMNFFSDAMLNSNASDPFNLSPMSDSDQLSDDDLALGASASPTGTEPMSGALSLTQCSPSSTRVKFGSMSEDESYQPAVSIRLDQKMVSSRLDKNSSPIFATSGNGDVGYVGLVNQAMTCYLNSLLQALFMTPEFRNALYKWESDNDNVSQNIPYQLQKLFLNLQTSKKSAIETTDLTRSFGWDGGDAWQQHDIQELCRVMFDALEQKFKSTPQENLISTLYEGKMIDYVKCLECNTEKSRADTFLDIPLPVRPFGHDVAYASVEEALRAFVQPETLDGNNQYFCEKCNKKCDAHKGLKFKTFPYILTLHLKRFDFDYTTMHRIKLNDKVTFPQTLNLNSFVSSADAQANGAANPNVAGHANGFVLNGIGTTTNNTDDCSTTDSGSAMEEDNCSSGIPTTAGSSQHENDMNDEDEGIDMSSSTDHRITSSSNTEQLLKQGESGPFMYELFAIMIHSGSASGGHYYAYIKEFDSNQWYCFNDQNVSPITQEDIQKVFGGTTNKGFYSHSFASSANAYMLMYRQIDQERNENPTTAQDFPEHINTLLPKISMEEEIRAGRSVRSGPITDLALPELIKPRVYFYNPQLKKLKVTRVYMSRAFDLESVLESAYTMLNVEQFAPLSRCRLVGYDQSAEEIIQSFENVNDSQLTEVRANWNGTFDFLLEYRADGQEFELYAPGGATWYVFMVNLATMEMDGPYLVYSAAHECNDVLRHSIATRLHVKEKEMLVATLSGKKAFVSYDPAPTKEASNRLQMVARLQFRNITYFYVNVPDTDPYNLEVMGIPPFEAPSLPVKVSADVVDAALINESYSVSTDLSRQTSSPLPQNLSTTAAPTVGHESNSENSSLSDGDRTLVENMQNRGGADSLISSCSHSPQLSSPEEESSHESLNRIQAFFNSAPPLQADSENSLSVPQFFHAIKIEVVDDTPRLSHRHSAHDSSDDVSRKTAHTYKVLLDSHMKIDMFKKHIEALIRVPANYFKIQRKYDSLEPLNMPHSLIFFNEGESLHVELGKILQPDEHRAKIFFMRLSELNNETGKLPCICEWIFTGLMTVGEAKKQLIAKLHRLGAKYLSLTLSNCRLWLKAGRNPIKILADEDPLSNEMRSSVPMEFLIQECEEGANLQADDDSLTIFVRRWRADQLQLDGFQEITLEKNGEIKNAVSRITDIPEENIAYSKINSSFPCTNISLLSLNSSMSWFSIPATLDKYPLTTTVNGNVYFYKDTSVEVKELTPDERRDWNNRERTRLDRLGSSSTYYTPRRERALKIHIDTTSTHTKADTSVFMETNSSSSKPEH